MSQSLAEFRMKTHVALEDQLLRFIHIKVYKEEALPAVQFQHLNLTNQASSNLSHYRSSSVNYQNEVLFLCARPRGFSLNHVRSILISYRLYLTFFSASHAPPP
jgi:hypothetical protein